MSLDRGHYWSGKDFLRQVHANLGLSSTFVSGALSKADPRFDPKMMQQELNNELRTLWMELAKRDPQRIIRHHDFTYPVDVEYVTLRPEQAGADGYVDPMLLIPWLDLRQLYDRTDTGQPREIGRVNFDEFFAGQGFRWAFQHDAIYAADRHAQPKLSTSVPMRLFYTPAPEQIDIENERPLRLIPFELQNAVALGAARRLLTQMRAKDTAGLREQHAYEAGLALDSVSRTIDRPEQLVMSDPCGGHGEW